MPGSARPSAEKPGKSQLEVMKEEAEVMQPSKNNVRKNFVKINATQSYKPRMRGAAFTNKMMAKKTNSLKFKARAA